MKILWIVNTIFPYPAKQMGMNMEVLGGWLNSLADQIIQTKEIELAIATVYKGKEIKEFYDGKIYYYLIPGAPAIKYDKKMENYWKEINKRFKPQLVHIHGTEYVHGLAYKRACTDVKVITSIQGLITNCAKVYYANMSMKDILMNITFRDVVRRDSIIDAKRKFEKRGKYEVELIKKSDVIVGRTTWDYSNTKAINHKGKYYIGNETLRSSFYQKQWDTKQIERHTIFVSQAYYPLKGLHVLLEAVKILKENYYSDVKLYVAGYDILKKGIKTTGYGKYIKKEIKEKNLSDNIEFTGLLDEHQMIDKLLKTNVFVCPSAIENSSNSLGEAMILGMPCVASNTGGTMDILKHEKEGMLYPYTEPAILAEYILRFFENDELCIQYGSEARKTALERHNAEKNVKQIMEIYQRTLEES